MAAKKEKKITGREFIDDYKMTEEEFTNLVWCNGKAESLIRVVETNRSLKRGGVNELSTNSRSVSVR
jgi:hypothetical protein